MFTNVLTDLYLFTYLHGLYMLVTGLRIEWFLQAHAYWKASFCELSFQCTSYHMSYGVNSDTSEQLLSAKKSSDLFLDLSDGQRSGF